MLLSFLLFLLSVLFTNALILLFSNGDYIYNLSYIHQLHNHFFFDLQFVKPFIKTANLSFPYMADCVVEIKDNYLDVHAVFSAMSLPWKNIRKLNNNYTLLINGTTYYNRLYHPRIEEVQIAAFSLPYSSNHSIDFTITDNTLKHTYPVQTTILHNPKKKKKIGVCTYVCDANSINEIKSWIAYYKMVGVDTILIYSALDLKELRNGIQNQINNGFVRWYSFPWPRYGRRKSFSIQKAQINSCYYRHRHEFEYIIVDDVDEYILSKSYPFNLYNAIKTIDNGEKDAFVVQSSNYKTMDIYSREEYLEKGLIFDKYVYYFNPWKLKRQKMIINTRSEGLFSVHVCFNCRIIHLNRSELEVFHIKKGVKVGKNDQIKNHSFYTNRFQQVLFHL